MAINHSGIRGRCTRIAGWQVTFHCPEDNAEYSWPFCYKHMMLARAGTATCSVHGRHLITAHVERLV
jgi:hypothetical protein